jgi:hypothetical protein
MRFWLFCLLAGIAGYTAHDYMATKNLDLAVLFDLQATPTPTDAHYQSLLALAPKEQLEEGASMGAFEKDYERAAAFERAKRQAQIDANRKRAGLDDGSARPDVVLNYEDVFGTHRSVDVTGKSSDQ